MSLTLLVEAHDLTNC